MASFSEKQIVDIINIALYKIHYDVPAILKDMCSEMGIGIYCVDYVSQCNGLNMSYVAISDDDVNKLVTSKDDFENLIRDRASMYQHEIETHVDKRDFRIN